MGKRMNPYTQWRLVLIFLLPSWAIAQTSPISAVSGMRAPKNIAHISGSIYPTVILPTFMTPAKQPGVTPPYRATPLGEAEITAVCLASSANAQLCGASQDAAASSRSGCDTESSYDDAEGAMTQPLMMCHGKYEPLYSHPAHMAFCDVDDVGVSGCLSRYANALVPRPASAKQVVHVTIRNSQGAVDVLTVLATVSETTDQITTEVLKEHPDITVEDVH